MPYQTGVLQDAPTGPDVILMPGGRAGRQTAPFAPAGNFIEGDPVGAAGDVQRADADAAEELFKGVYPKLAGWVRRLVDNDDTAHEIASEAFVRLLARWTRLESPQSYLYMIATNLVRDHWRKAERERRAMRTVTVTCRRCLSLLAVLRDSRRRRVCVPALIRETVPRPITGEMSRMSGASRLMSS